MSSKKMKPKQHSGLFYTLLIVGVHSAVSFSSDAGAVALESEDSPFAIFGSDAQSVSGLGVHWWWSGDYVRPCDQYWLTIKYCYDQVKGSGINRTVDVVPAYPHASGEPSVRINLVEFYRMMTNTVIYCNEVKYWSVGVEPDIDPIWTPEALAMYTRMVYKAVKNTDVSKKVVQGGSYGAFASYEPPYVASTTNQAGHGYFVRVFDLLDQFEAIEHNHSLYDWSSNVLNITTQEFDVLFSPDGYSIYLDGHHFSNFGRIPNDYRQYDQQYSATIRQFMDQRAGTNVFLWDTQTGFHSGTVRASTYTESDQASFLLKKHLSSRFYGVERVFWTSIQEWVWEGNPEHYFSKVGLIYDGQGVEDQAAGVKKLAYHTYKKMVQMLDGSDWSSLQLLRNGTGGDYVYIYQVTRNGQALRIAWWDYFDDVKYGSQMMKTVTLTNLASTAIAVESAVPFALTGRDIGDYDSAFRSTGYAVSNGTASIALGRVPVYIESDSDGDGLGDSWEQTIMLNWQLNDTDGDGVSDGCEVAAGTDAKDNQSMLAITGLHVQGTNCEVTVSGTAGRVYRLWSLDELPGLGGPWQFVESQGSVTGAPTILKDSGQSVKSLPTNTWHRFYRVDAALPDLSIQGQ